MAAKTCAICDADLSEDARYCAYCGAPAEVDETVAGRRRICEFCGTRIGKGQKFCHSCGTAYTPPISACPDCGAELIEGGAFCGECGAKIPESALSRVIIAPAYTEGKKPQAMPKKSPKATDNVKKGGTRVKRRIKRTRKNKKGTDGCS